MLHSPQIIEPANVKGGVFVSDLHLFSPRSDACQIRKQLSLVTCHEQCIVLGGDIFDFRWSDKGGHLATLRAAHSWLYDLLESTGDTQIVFLPGNHDCHPEFLAQLSELADEVPRFTWFDHHVQIGDSLFLHGDILDARNNVRGLPAYRSKFHHATPQPRIAHRTYDMAVGMRIHKLVPRVRHHPLLTVQRLWSHIQHLPLSQQRKVARVYFGHTHVPIHGLRWKEIQFFNPGAALRHMNPQIHRFTFEAPGGPTLTSPIILPS